MHLAVTFMDARCYKNVNVIIGLDIVDALIVSNNKSYRNENIIFETKDICNDKIPNCDLLIVEIAFFTYHIAIDSFLRNIYKCEYAYLLLQRILLR